MRVPSQARHRMTACHKELHGSARRVGGDSEASANVGRADIQISHLDRGNDCSHRRVDELVLVDKDVQGIRDVECADFKLWHRPIEHLTSHPDL